MFSLFRKKAFFSAEEQERIVEAVRWAEQRTSGEVRVYVESRCKYMSALDRAVELFGELKMDQTQDRNAVLVYVAIKDRQLAVFGDEGIHRKVGDDYWRNEVAVMLGEFNHQHIADGIRKCVMDIGDALHTYFPYDREVDKNELPDDIVFGR